MNLTISTRRRFLGSMAILSVGAAFGSVPEMLFSSRAKPDIQKQWDDFCELSGGSSYSNHALGDAINVKESSAGHLYKTGQAIFFGKENMVAVPAWIYWESDNRKPSDMLITFYEKKEGRLERMITYNRFEMEAIYKTYGQVNGLSFIKSSTPENMVVKTTIGKYKLKQHIGYFKSKEILFENNFIYHT